MDIWKHWLRIAAASGVIGVVLGFAGAFDTSSMPIVPRLIYWVGLLLSGTVVGLGVAHLLLCLTVLKRHLWLGGAAISLAISVPMTVIVAVASYWGMMRDLDLNRLLQLFPTVLLVSVATTAIGMMTVGAPPVETHAAPDGASPPKFLERIPLKLRGADLFAVEAEDHYLRLHTSKGQDLILMRLSDAVGELEGIEGAQVHRSWWVAKDAVVEAERGDGRATLTLKGGAEAPVSRAYARTLRAEGWF